MTRTVGVEEEFLLAQGKSPLLAAAGEDVVAGAEARSDGQFEHELKQEQAELGTAPHHTMAELDRDLRARRGDLAAAASVRGVRLLASATSPLDQNVSTTADDRYERMTELFGRVARTQLTCGMHVHVSVDSPQEGVHVLDRLGPWLPALVALSANSPYFEGQDTDYASYRTVLWGAWPTAGVTQPFGTVEEYERARSALIATGAALDEGMIYFNARLSARYPTVEVRVCDVCADVRDVPVLAAIIRAMVSTTAEQGAAGEPLVEVRSELLRAAMWRAARWGTEHDLVDAHTGNLVPAWDLVDGLVETLTPALKGSGDEQLVQDGLARIRSRGTGARLQREAYAGGGIAAVVDALADRTASTD